MSLRRTTTIKEVKRLIMEHFDEEIPKPSENQIEKKDLLLRKVDKLWRSPINTPDNIYIDGLLEIDSQIKTK